MKTEKEVQDEVERLKYFILPTKNRGMICVK